METDWATIEINGAQRILVPWGNRIEIVSYDNVQFTKAPNVLRGMGLSHLPKNEKAMKELSGKGMALN
jgi:predicted nuclease with RNAse H fold